MKKEEKAMRNNKRTTLIVLALVALLLLAVGGTAGAMALTHSGFMGNGSGMMGGQYSHGSMMGGTSKAPSSRELRPPAAALT